MEFLKRVKVVGYKTTHEKCVISFSFEELFLSLGGIGIRLLSVGLL